MKKRKRLQTGLPTLNRQLLFAGQGEPRDPGTVPNGEDHRPPQAGRAPCGLVRLAPKVRTCHRSGLACPPRTPWAPVGSLEILKLDSGNCSPHGRTLRRPQTPRGPDPTAQEEAPSASARRSRVLFSHQPPQETGADFPAPKPGLFVPVGTARGSQSSKTLPAHHSRGLAKRLLGARGRGPGRPHAASSQVRPAQITTEQEKREQILRCQLSTAWVS